ncbi:Amylopullulanase [Paenibacillus sp. P22]|nr:Amylopullulanase [Paenibacillus sp. P22]
MLNNRNMRKRLHYRYPLALFRPYSNLGGNKMKWQRIIRNRSIGAVMACLLVLQLLAGIGQASIVSANSEVSVPPASSSIYQDQPGGTSSWYVAGTVNDWNNADANWKFKHLTGGLYAYTAALAAGDYEFKLTKNGTWDGFGDNGNNFKLKLDQAESVTFFVNDEIGQARISVPGVHGLAQYVPSLDDMKWPRLVGTMQKKLGDPADWDPAGATYRFLDYNLDGSVYKLQVQLPEGRYEAKVAFGPSWEENYGATGPNGGNLNIVGGDDLYAIFSIDYKGDQKLKADTFLAGGGSNGKINKDAIQFDSRSLTFKKPFGAIAENGADLTLRVAAAKDDVQMARVELTNAEGLASTHEMRKVTTVDGKDYWEAIIPKSVFTGIGIWGYKFILIDGSAKLELGDDKNGTSSRGGTGMAAEDGAVPFDLTVYKADYKTPDWMKNAVVYQIFPDRFFDGNPDNNRAKLVDGYRGDRNENRVDKDAPIKSLPLQYFDGGVANDPAPGQVAGQWSDVPENPDRVKPENKPYYPNATSDGTWTNEFYGGDIQGIGMKLDYLQSLGVTAIYLNPVAWAASNHKYDATDYKHLDPMFGEPVYNKPGDPASGLNYEETRKASDKVFIDFSKAVKARGMHLITDGVFNHVGDDSIYFDRYGKYPEIGAYEYWAKVYDLQNAAKDKGESLDKAAAEQQARAFFTGKVNPATGKNYEYPADFGFIDWFTVENVKVADKDSTSTHYKYDAWWGYDSLPAMDAKTPQPGDADAIGSSEEQHEWNNIGYREAVIGHDLSGKSAEDAEAAMQNVVSQRWPWMGSGGWRLDVAPDVSTGTWQKFREAVKSTAGLKDAGGNDIEDPIILGEEWGVATHYLLGDQFDSVMNYRFRGALQAFLIGGDAKTFNDTLESIREDYPEQAWQAMLNLVDSHDTTRSITKLMFPNYEEEHLVIAKDADDKALKQQALVALFQMGYPGAPTIYYGDEVGVTGTKDPDSRRTFPWERVVESEGPDGKSYSATGSYAGLLDSYQKAAKLREAEAVLRTGDLKAVYATGDAIAYARKNDTKAALVSINRGDAAQKITADVTGYLPDGLTLVDGLGSGISAVVTGGKLEYTLPALSGVMMISEGALSPVAEVGGLLAKAGNGSVELSWNAVDGAEGYRVYRSLIDGGKLELAGTSTEAAFTDTAVTNGTKYYYSVAAFQGASEGLPGPTVSATPAYPITEVSAVSTVAADVYLGVGRTTGELTVSVKAPGLTDRGDGLQPAGLIGKLMYFPDGSAKAEAASKPLKFKADGAGGDKVYAASFEPLQAGVYHYYAAFSADNGETWTESTGLSHVTVFPNEDTDAPAPPALAAITVESSRAVLNWTSEDDSVYGFEIYRAAGADGSFVRIASVTGGKRSYTDFTVSNDTTYRYKVAAYDMAYNRSFSEEQSVTPKLVMVDVTLRLHLPDYTPSTDDITIAGDFNGWNVTSTKLNVPSGATNRSVVEYTFKMMAGKSIQYKYARGDWDKEALTSHKHLAGDTTDPGNWAYSSTDTNMQLQISNQGGNRMVVDDYVLRWVDMPLMVLQPRISYGEDIRYSTDENHWTLSANVPYGVAFTINNQPIADGAMDAQGNVYLKNIPLMPGENKFVLHIEPTQETLNLPFYTDKGRASQATKTINVVIDRSSGEATPSAKPSEAPSATPSESPSATPSESPSATPSPSSPPSTPAPTAAPSASPSPTPVGQTFSILAADLKPDTGGEVNVTLGEAVQTVLIPREAAGLAAGSVLRIHKGTTTIVLPQELLAAAAAEGKGSLVLRLDEVSGTEADALLAGLKKQGRFGSLAAIGSAIKARLLVQNGDSEQAVSAKGMKLSFKAASAADGKTANVYRIDGTGTGTYVRGTWNGADGSWTVPADGSSAYALLHAGREFADLPAGHWSAAAVQFLAARELVNGVSEQQFAPNKAVTRAEFAAMLARILELKPGSAKPFADVGENAWYADSVSAAYDAGIIGGRGRDAFAPGASVTREEMAVMLMRAYAYGIKEGILTAVPSNPSVPSFKDESAISGWAAKDVLAAAGLGLLGGRDNGSFAPGDQLTRAESAAALYRLLSR